MTTEATPQDDLPPSHYHDLAEFRRQIRRYLHFSESAARAHGVEPQQHQLLLVVRALPPNVPPTIGEIASRLFLEHHSTVELANRLERKQLIVREPSQEDRRQVHIRLTAEGLDLLRRLALAHRAELERSGPELARALQATLRNFRRSQVSPV